MRKIAYVIALVLFMGAAAIAQPAQPVRVGGNVPPPKKIKDVRPAYPPLAQSARVQGVVIIEAIIGPDGHVQDARILRSIPLLDASALEAVRQWEFTQTTVNGVAVPVIMTVTVNYTLQDDNLLARSCADEPSMRSPDGALPTKIEFINQTEAPRNVYWLDASGVRHRWLTVAPGETSLQTTSVGHTWIVTDSGDVCTAVYVASAISTRAVLSRSVFPVPAAPPPAPR
jgi:TonB family protein